MECEARWSEALGEWLCLLHDVSAGKRAEAASARRLNMLRAAGRQRAGADRLATAPATLRCQFANKGYAHTFGHDEHAIVGKTLPR